MTKGIRGSTTQCSVLDCDRNATGYGYCEKHYRRWKKYGDPLMTRPTADERLWSRIDKNGPVPACRPDLGPCWLYTAGLNDAGYGILTIGTKRNRAHRLVYEKLVGPIPEGSEPDHLCRVRAYCNPEHLEVVSHRVNTLRGDSPLANFARQTHCKRNHEFTPENTYRAANGGRICRACHRGYELARYHRLRLT